MVNTKIHCSPIGQVLRQRYEIVRLLSSGAFGHTYVARDQHHEGGPCLVKHYQSHQGYPHLLKTSRRLFVTEAETLRTLGIHDQIPRFIDCFEEQEQFYLVQELVVGQPLSEELSLLNHASLRDCHSTLREREAEVIYFLQDLLHILDFVHSQGTIHCDVKPNNILRRAKDGKLVLIDFGAAQPIRSPERDREVNRFLPLKSPIAVSPSGYLAAEQLAGRPYPNSDLYAAGIIAIQILTGIDPAKLQLNLETHEIDWKQLQAHQRSPSALHRPLTAILRQMVRYNHQQRYQSAREVLRALEPLLEPARRSLLQTPAPANRPAADTAVDIDLQDNLQDNLQDTAPDPVAASPILPLVPPAGLKQLVPLSSAVAGRNGSAPPAPKPPALPTWEDWQDTADPPSPESAASAPAKSAASLKPWQVSPQLMAILTRAGILVAVLNLFALAFGLYTLANQRETEPGARRLAQANRALQRGDLEGAIALAQAIPSDSEVYAESQQAIADWQRDWQQAAQQVKAAEQAVARADWGTVLTLGESLPALDYWQRQMQPLVNQANEQAEAAAKDLLAQASQAAYERNFTQALDYLGQIVPKTTIGQRIQPKIEEYRLKEQIRAMHFLQRAYDQAAVGEFKAAIAELQQIPAHTPAGQTAREKLVEYTEKQSIREQLTGTVNWSTPPERAPAPEPRQAAPAPPADEPGSSAEPFIELPGDSTSLNPGSSLREAVAGRS